VNRERYQQLVECLLDEELSPADADELLAGLRKYPEFQRDLRQQLMLWDVWSQRTDPQRSVEAFVEAWKTRVRAEAGSEQFSQSVLARVSAPAAALTWRMSFWKRWRPVQIAFALFALTFLAAAGWWAQQQFWNPKTPPSETFQSSKPAAGKFVTISGEGVCACCVLHETSYPGPAIRLQKGGKTIIVYLKFKGYSQALHQYFAGGTTVKAKGILNKNGGQLSLETQSIEVNGVEYR
jgi:hypothetical protein